MNEQDARDDLRLIREMLEKTRRATAESGTLFIFWGIWLILALVGNYTLVYLHRYGWIWVNWAFFGFGGWVVSAVYHIRRGRARLPRTYAQTASAYVSIACSVGFALAAFVFPALKVYSYGVISVIIALVSGILLMALSGIYQLPLLLGAGILWWIGAVVMAFIPDDWRGLVFIPLLVLGYLVPGFIFRSRFRRNRGVMAAS
jgi:hypothetical protein